MVVSDQRLKFKNKHADKLLEELSKEASQANDHLLDPDFDQSSFILKAQIFRPDFKKADVNAP